MRFRLRSLLLLVVVSSVLLGAGRFLLLRSMEPVFPVATLEKLQYGMTPEEVKAILGNPSAILTNEDAQHAYGPQWSYERAFNPGWVDLGFDEAGRLSWVDDEGAWPTFFELREPSSQDAN